MEYAALLISLVALGFSIYGVIESRRNNRATHRPAIVGHETKGTNEYKYEIINKGNGPAFFKKVEWFWDKRPLEGKSISDAVSEIVHAYGLPPTQTVTELGQKAILGTGERLVVGSIAIQPEHIPIIQEIEKKGFGVRITYESGFGEEDIFVSADELKHI